jgi:hypothetical protein
MSLMEEETTPAQEKSKTGCWFCTNAEGTACACHRYYCAEHSYRGRCLVCALGLGLFEKSNEPETVSGLITLSLSAASGDPYIVVPQTLAGATPLPLDRAEKLVAAVIKMLATDDNAVLLRAATTLAATTNSWPTMDPSALTQNKYGTSLLATDQVRRWLLQTLKQSRSRSSEPVALAILEKLRTADFRDLYPGIVDNLKLLTCSIDLSRVRATFEALLDYYPAYSHLANELCEVFVYEQYSNRTKGAGNILERIYGPMLKQSPTLARILKKGTWLSSHARYKDWYFGEEDPV